MMEQGAIRSSLLTTGYIASKNVTNGLESNEHRLFCRQFPRIICAIQQCCQTCTNIITVVGHRLIEGRLRIPQTLKHTESTCLWRLVIFSMLWRRRDWTG